MPEGFRVEYMPEKSHINSMFGTYTSHYIQKNNQLVYIRKIERKQGRYPSSAFHQFASFMNAISKADKEKIVLVRK